MKIIYDEIFIGCSLSIILKALLSKKKILIIEKVNIWVVPGEILMKI